MFAVVHVEALPDHLRGYTSRFLQEVKTGLHVGLITPTVADRLWDRIQTHARTGAAVMITSDPETELGYNMRLHNTTRTALVDFDGLQLPVIRT